MSARAYWIGLCVVALVAAVAASSEKRPAIGGLVVPTYRPVSGVPSMFSGEMVTVAEALAERRMVEAYADAVVERMEARR